MKFAEEMLLRYAKNQNVYMISGGNFTPMQQSEMSDYFLRSQDIPVADGRRGEGHGINSVLMRI